MTADWPGDSSNVVRWVRSAMHRMGTDGDVDVKGLDDIKVSADLTGTDLQHLTLDATGVTLRIRIHDGSANPAPADREPETPETPEPDARETGVLRTFRFIARPMRIEKTPLSIDLQMHDVPISWLTFAEPSEPGVPESIHAVLPDDDLNGSRGTFKVAIATKDLAPLITSVLRPTIRTSGFHLGRVRLDVMDDGIDGIRVTAYAGARFKLLMASARAVAHIQVTRDAVITVRNLTVGSRNLLVKLGLLFARSQIRDVIGQSVDLNEMIAKDGATIRIHDLRVSTGEQLSVEGRFG